MINLVAIFNKRKKSKNYQQNHKQQLITRVKTDEQQQVPFITITLGKSNYDVMLDTGANQSVFDISILKVIKKIHPNIEPVDYETLVTGFGHQQTVEIYEFPILIKERLYYITASFAELNIIDEIEKEHNIKLVGVIGNDFFEKYKCILNYYNHKLYGLFNNKK